MTNPHSVSVLVTYLKAENAFDAHNCTHNPQPREFLGKGSATLHHYGKLATLIF